MKKTERIAPLVALVGMTSLCATMSWAVDFVPVVDLTAETNRHTVIAAGAESVELEADRPDNFRPAASTPRKEALLKGFAL